jgi:hypothetical protein
MPWPTYIQPDVKTSKRYLEDLLKDLRKRVKL